MAKKIVKYTDFKNALRYTMEDVFDVYVENKESFLIATAVDNLIEELGISEYVDFDTDEASSEPDIEELDFDE